MRKGAAAVSPLNAPDARHERRERLIRKPLIRDQGNVTERSRANSFLRWAGSKRQLLPKLRGFWSDHYLRYIEPFAGSACLFFDLEPRSAILADLNQELICTLRAIQRDVYLVLECLRRLPKGEIAYYKVRKLDTSLLSDTEIAARFIYLNRYCFNGLYRTNGLGKFNVPYGPPKSGLPANENTIINAARVLQQSMLIAGDFEATLAYADTGDFVYLDPPYVTDSRRVFSEYLPNTFTKKDLARLSNTLDSLDKRGTIFLVSYADSPEARKLLAKWRPKRILTRRNIAGFAGSRKGAYELIATNKKC